MPPEASGSPSKENGACPGVLPTRTVEEMRATSAILLSKKASLPGRLPATTIRRPAAPPFSSLSFPLRRKNIIAAIGPVPTTRTSCAAVGDAPEPAYGAREGIEQRGGLVRHPFGDPPEGVPREPRGHEEKLGERAEQRSVERSLAEVLAARATGVARAARRRDRGRHARASRPGGSRTRLLDDARPLVPERQGERKLRVSAPRDLEVGPAGERHGHADEDLARAGPGHRHVPEHRDPGAVADERAHAGSVAGARARPRRNAAAA